MIADLFTKSEKHWAACLSDLMANFSGPFRLQSGKQYDNINAFLDDCHEHRDQENDITHWEYVTENGERVMIFND